MESEASPPTSAAVSAPGIITLPAETLHLIFSNFQDSSILGPGYILPNRRVVGDIVSRKTIASARLTCRLFHVVATPLLLPFVRVSLDQESLDRMDKISRNPLLSGGVHGVHVDLRYRPKELADNIDLFADFRARELEALNLRPDFCREGDSGWDGDCDWEGCECEEDCACEGDDGKANFYESLDVSELWEEAWGINTEYRKSLTKGHSGYRRKHKEQRRLITTGSFLRDLAVSIARLPRWGSLDFHDKHDMYYWHSTKMVDSFGTMDSLVTFLKSACTWSRIEEVNWVRGYNGGEIAATRILSELPIAIHNAGRGLRHLNMGSFPTLSRNLDLLLPRASSGMGQTWEDLGVAFANLESVCLRGAYGPHRDNNGIIRTSGQEPVNKCLGAAVSGLRLKTVAIHSHGHSLNFSDIHSPKYRLGRVLSSVTSPSFHTFIASEVSVHPREVEEFCSRLNSRKVRVDFKHVALEEGSWDELLHSLRRRARVEGWDRAFRFDSSTRSFSCSSSN